jgi:flagellar basal-body rod protein FlgB
LQPLYVFSLAAQHERWASLRQVAITGNIANANTTNYVGRDIEPFSAALDDAAGVTLARTQPGHLGISSEAGEAEGRDWQMQEIEGPVALDKQLVMADETSRAVSLDTSIVRAFHRMLLSAVRSA